MLRVKDEGAITNAAVVALFRNSNAVPIRGTAARSRHDQVVNPDVNCHFPKRLSKMGAPNDRHRQRRFCKLFIVWTLGGGPQHQRFRLLWWPPPCTKIH